MLIVLARACPRDTIAQFEPFNRSEAQTAVEVRMALPQLDFVLASPTHDERRDVYCLNALLRIPSYSCFFQYFVLLFNV